MKTKLNNKINYVNCHRGVGLNRVGKLALKPNKKVKPPSELSLRLHQNNIEKMNLNRLVCVKTSTTGEVFRVPLIKATRMVKQVSHLSIVDKQEWKEYLTKVAKEKVWKDGLGIITSQGHDVRSTYNGISRKNRRYIANLKEWKKKKLNQISNITEGKKASTEKIIENHYAVRSIFLTNYEMRLKRRMLKTSTKQRTWKCPDKKITYTISPLKLKRLEIEKIRRLKN